MGTVQSVQGTSMVKIMSTAALYHSSIWLAAWVVTGSYWVSFVHGIVMFCYQPVVWHTFQRRHVITVVIVTFCDSTHTSCVYMKAMHTRELSRVSYRGRWPGWGGAPQISQVKYVMSFSSLTSSSTKHSKAPETTKSNLYIPRLTGSSVLNIPVYLSLIVPAQQKILYESLPVFHLLGY